MCYSKKIQALNCEVPLDWLVVVHILVFQQKRMLESAEKLIDLDFIFGSETFLPEYRIFPEVFVAQEKNFNLHHLGCCETFINKMMQSLIHRSLSSKQKISEQKLLTAVFADQLFNLKIVFKSFDKILFAKRNFISIHVDLSN